MFTSFATALAVFAASASATQLQSHPYYAGLQMNTNELQNPDDGEVEAGHYLFD